MVTKDNLTTAVKYISSGTADGNLGLLTLNYNIFIHTLQ